MQIHGNLYFVHRGAVWALFPHAVALNTAECHWGHTVRMRLLALLLFHGHVSLPHTPSSDAVQTP